MVSGLGDGIEDKKSASYVICDIFGGVRENASYKIPALFGMPEKLKKYHIVEMMALDIPIDRRKTYIRYLDHLTGVEIQPGITIDYNTIELFHLGEDHKTSRQWMDLEMADYDMSVCKVGLYTDKDTPPFLYAKEAVTVKPADDWEKFNINNQDYCEKRLKKYKQRMLCYGKPASLARLCCDKLNMEYI